MKLTLKGIYTWERWKVQRQMAISPWVRHTCSWWWGWAIFVSRVRHFLVLKVSLDSSDRGSHQDVNEGVKTTETWVQELLPCVLLSDSELRSSDNFNSCPIAFVLWCPLQSFLLSEMKNGVSCFQKRCLRPVWSCFKGCTFSDAPAYLTRFLWENHTLIESHKSG